MSTSPGTSPLSGVSADQVSSWVMASIPEGGEPSIADVERTVDHLLQLYSHLQDRRTSIIDDVLRRLSVRIGEATILTEDDAAHIDWLEKADRSEWRLWPRLEKHLAESGQLPRSVLRELDRSTDTVLAELEDPNRGSAWDRRGLVVGHVQSGKTTHYTSLAAKALDAGYQIVIILAGVHNSLRSQTHDRIDRQLIGRDSAAIVESIRSGLKMKPSEALIGVGKQDQQQGNPPLPFTIMTCTNADEMGDFNADIARKVGLSVSHGMRLVMVVKKNATILRPLIQWLQMQNAQSGTAAGDAHIAAPTLVIDDEADHASVDVARPQDTDPTTINRLIRQLLNSFDRVAFVGYTATPFANVFIRSDADHATYGRDLFPQAFILNLKTPDDYVGPDLVFGHPGDESVGIAEQLPLPFHIPVSDSQGWLPEKHNKNAVPGPLPNSLKEAIRLFILDCAARMARGQSRVHNSMLIHATRFVDVQSRITDQIQTELNTLRNILGLSGAQTRRQLVAAMHELWVRTIEAGYPAFKARLGDRCPVPTPWDAVEAQLTAAVDRIDVRRIHGESDDVLDYARNKQGIYTIAVGGDKLSRGLTLEGLTVSYFLRSSKMFDTLMQMGRWFGYRKGYIDLCRVYTTPQLFSAFRQIALAMDELRRELDRMAAARKSPIEFGLRVREPTDGLLITAANKIRNGEQIDVRFADSLVQTLVLPRTGERAVENTLAVQRLLSALPADNFSRSVRGKPTAHAIWRQVPVQQVLGFLEAYEADDNPCFGRGLTGKSDAVRRYILAQQAQRELVNWTVAVISKRVEENDEDIDITFQRPSGPLCIRTVFRTNHSPTPDLYQMRAVVGSADEAIDLDETQFAASLSAGAEGKQSIKREIVREQRGSANGLLLIYLIRDANQQCGYTPAVAISFSASDTAQPLSYKVNDVYRRLSGLEDDSDEITA